MSKIVVVFVDERNSRTGRTEKVVSHGVDISTDRVVILPTDTFKEFRSNMEYDNDLEEWVLKDI